MRCNHNLCPFSAKNGCFVHGLLILSIMFDKIIQKRRKRHGENIVNAIVEQMEKENLLNIEMKEYFTYSIAMIIEKWITIISVLFVGGIFKQTVQMILFLFFFLLLRKRTGGYRASSFLHCYIETIIISIVVIHMCLISARYMMVIYLLVICSILVISFIGVVNHPNLALDYVEVIESVNCNLRFHTHISD